MEKVWKTKGGVYVALLMMLVMILFINANPSGATSLVLKMSSNNSAPTSSGFSSIHDSLITDHQSLEFLLGPEMATTNMVAVGSLVPSQPVVTCGRNMPYTTSCLPGSQNAKTGEICFNLYGEPTHNRGCP